MTGPDFGALHAAMRKHVDDQLIPCVSTALLRGREVVDVFCYGFADREAVVPLRDDHIFRVLSNTKLVTSCAVMLLVEDGRIALNDPIEAYLPELGSLTKPRGKTARGSLGSVEPSGSDRPQAALAKGGFRTHSERPQRGPPSAVAGVVAALLDHPLST